MRRIAFVANTCPSAAKKPDDMIYTHLVAIVRHILMSRTTLSRLKLYQFDPYIDTDLPPEAPSFIMRVCGFGFHILHRHFGQARRVRSPQFAQAHGALQRVFGFRVMSAV